MQKLLLSLFVCCGLALSLALPVGAQDSEAKNLYLAHASNPQRGSAGVKVRLELKRNGVRKMVPLGFEFRSGDMVKFHFETNFSAYVKILNHGTDGTWELLFPYAGVSEVVPKTKDYALPQGDEWFKFDQTRGIERLSFVFSSSPLQTAVAAAPAPPAPNGGTVRVNRPQSAPTSNNGSEQQALEDLNTRALANSKNLNLVKDRDNNGDCAYVVADAVSLRKPLAVRVNLIHN